MANNPRMNVPPGVTRTITPTVVTRTPTTTITPLTRTNVTPVTRTTPTTIVTRTPTTNTTVTRSPTPTTATRVISDRGPPVAPRNLGTTTNNNPQTNISPSITITGTSGGNERLNTSSTRRTNRVGMNMNDAPTDRRSIMSFRQLEGEMPTKGDKRKTIKSPMGDRSNRVSRLTPEEKERRKTIRQSMRQEENIIQLQMHKFVQEMASIEEKMQQERRYNEELTDNYNELLDILINTVTQLEDMLPNYGKLRDQPSQTNFQDFEKDLNSFRTGIYRSIGEVHRNQAKERLDEEKVKSSKPNAPTPPTPPPPPSLAKAKGPAVNLLSEIHKGINLKKVDQDNVKREHDNLMVKSVSTLSDLQNILSKALNERSNQILGNDEEDWSDEENDDDWN